MARVRAHRADAAYFCDPVLGDDPKGLYIAEEAARALAAKLVPLADVIFPNRFELAWLSSQPVTDVASAENATVTRNSFQTTRSRLQIMRVARPRTAKRPPGVCGTASSGIAYPPRRRGEGLPVGYRSEVRSDTIRRQ